MSLMTMCECVFTAYGESSMIMVDRENTLIRRRSGLASLKRDTGYDFGKLENQWIELLHSLGGVSIGNASS